MQLPSVFSIRTLICGWLCFVPILALSQNNACEDPNAPRTASITMSRVSDEKPGEAEYTKRAVAAESKMAAQIRKTFGDRFCYLSDGHLLDDPKNFPRLSGTIEMEIHAVPSFSNANIYALSVTTFIVRGVNIEDAWHLSTDTFVIERDSDYEFAATVVFQSYKSMIDVLTKHGKKSS